jgi:hypothetical protein
MTPKLIDQVREAQDIYDGPSRNSRTYGLQRMQALAPAMARHILATEERLKAAEKAIAALAPMLDDDPSFDEQRAGRAALAAFKATEAGE